jgi:hypothetical protein
MTNRRKAPRIFVPLFVAFMGAAALFNVVSSPSFEGFRAIDVVRLIAAGGCFGAALVMLLRGPSN